MPNSTEMTDSPIPLRPAVRIVAGICAAGGDIHEAQSRDARWENPEPHRHVGRHGRWIHAIHRGRLGFLRARGPPMSLVASNLRPRLLRLSGGNAPARHGTEVGWPYYICTPNRRRSAFSRGGRLIILKLLPFSRSVGFLLLSSSSSDGLCFGPHLARPARLAKS